MPKERLNADVFQVAGMFPRPRPWLVEVLPLGRGPGEWAEKLGEGVERALGCRCSMLDGSLDLTFAFLPDRGQFSSSEILLYLGDNFANGEAPPGADRALLAVTDADLTVPIFTFVFGEALHGGPCALISGHRLRQEFYGLPPDPALFEERLLKMAVHELGHTRGLSHCANYGCVMATSYGIERLDLKSLEFCPACAREMEASRL